MIEKRETRTLFFLPPSLFVIVTKSVLYVVTQGRVFVVKFLECNTSIKTKYCIIYYYNLMSYVILRVFNHFCVQPYHDLKSPSSSTFLPTL